MMKKSIYLFFSLTMLSVEVFSQQDDQLSQYTFNPISVNPAYAGSKGALGIIASARNQWTGFDGAPKTAAIAIHSPLKGQSSSIGFRLRDEKSVFDQKLEASACYAFRFKFLNGKLALGVSAGVTNITYNWFNVTFKDNNDKYANLNRSQVLVPRFDGGLFFNNKKTYLSISATHLYDQMSVNSSSSNYNGSLIPHVYLVYSRAFKVSENFTLNPAINCKWTQAATPLADLNLYGCINNFLWIGAGYRNNGSMIFLTQVVINKQYRIGYSYDYFPYKQIMTSYQTHEIMLSCDLNVFKSNALSFRYF